MTPEDIIKLMNAEAVSTVGGLLASLQTTGEAVMLDEMGQRVCFYVIEARCHHEEEHTDVIIHMQAPTDCKGGCER